MERNGVSVPFLTTEEYFQLIEDAALHLASLRGFGNCALKEDWCLAEHRILSVISGLGVQFDGNTRFRR